MMERKHTGKSTYCEAGGHQYVVITLPIRLGHDKFLLHDTGHLQSWHRQETDTGSLPSRENHRTVEATELFSWQLPPDV